MIGDNRGRAYNYEDGKLVSVVRNPPEGMFPFNYIMEYLRVKYRKYFDKNPVVRTWLKQRWPCKTCGYQKCICKSNKLLKNYSVVVYEIDNLHMIYLGNDLPKFLQYRTIIKQVVSRDKDVTMYHVIEIEDEPDFEKYGGNEIRLVDKYFVNA